MKQRITSKKWLQNEKNLIGKTLCVVDRGFRGIDPKTGIHTLRFSQTDYIIDITKVKMEEMKAIDWIYGKTGIYIENAPSLDFKDDTPVIGSTECTSINYCSDELFNRCEYYVMDREEAIEEIKEYNRKVVKDLYKI